MEKTTRRQFAHQTLGSLLTYSLLDSLFSTDAFADEVKPVAAKWLKELHDLSVQMKGQKVKQEDWQKQVEKLFKHVDVKELLKFVNFEKLTKNLKFRDRGERALQFRLPAVEGLPTRLVFGHQIFALKKGQSVVPHGHDNMATAFLILDGKFHGRHYDRLEDSKEHMIIKPTIDDQFERGGCSTISEHKDNVHWFKSLTETAFIFNIHVMNLHQGKRNGRVYIDPKGEKLSGGRIRARRISGGEATKLYG